MNEAYTTTTVVTIDGIPSDKVIKDTAGRVLPIMITRSYDGAWRTKHITSNRILDWTKRSEQDATAAAIEHANRNA